MTASARQQLNETVSKLNAAVATWNANVARDAQSRTGLSSAVTNYSSYLSEVSPFACSAALAHTQP